MRGSATQPGRLAPTRAALLRPEPTARNPTATTSITQRGVTRPLPENTLGRAVEPLREHREHPGEGGGTAPRAPRTPWGGRWNRSASTENRWCCTLPRSAALALKVQHPARA